MKKTIEEHIRQGELKLAIKVFLESIEPDHPLERELTLLSRRIFTLEQEQNRGTISVDNRRLEEAKISEAVVTLLKKWEPAGQLSGLAKIVDGLQFFHDLDFGPLLTVNCDRKKQVRKFRKKFNEKATNRARFQFYFLAGCPDQMPDSLAERLIFQIIDEECREKTIHYPLLDGSQRLMITPAPLGSDQEASIKKFKARVQERFKFIDTQSFDSFLETGLPKIRYDFVATAYSLSEKDWVCGVFGG